MGYRMLDLGLISQSLPPILILATRKSLSDLKRKRQIQIMKIKETKTKVILIFAAAAAALLTGGLCRDGIRKHNIAVVGGGLPRANAANAPATANLCRPATVPSSPGHRERKDLLRLQRRESGRGLHRPGTGIPALPRVSGSAADCTKLLHGSG